MLPILDYAKESYEDMKHDVRQEGAVQARQEEVVVVRVDHMRRSGPYLRTLEAWSSQLGLATLVAVSRDRGIVIIAEGDRAQLTKLLLNWKTVNIDVDSRGKPCKERMIQVVYRERKENQEVLLLEDCTENRFTIVNCDKLLEYFEHKKILSLMKSVFN